MGDELAQLVHELRQSLSAALLLCDPGVREEDADDGPEVEQLLAQSLHEALEVMGDLSALAQRLSAAGAPGAGERPEHG